MANFKGYIKIPLDGPTMEDMIKRTVATGHWLTKRNQIMKKPRKYTATIHFKTFDGDTAVETYDVKDRTTPGELSEVIRQYAVKVYNDNPDAGIDLFNSVAVIRT